MQKLFWFWFFSLIGLEIMLIMLGEDNIWKYVIVDMVALVMGYVMVKFFDNGYEQV